MKHERENERGREREFSFGSIIILWFCVFEREREGEREVVAEKQLEREGERKKEMQKDRNGFVVMFQKTFQE